MEFYRVYVIWSDGMEEADVITAVNLDNAIHQAQERIAETTGMWGQYEEDFIEEIVFWNEIEDEAFCSVKEDEVIWYDTKPAEMIANRED